MVILDISRLENHFKIFQARNPNATQASVPYFGQREISYRAQALQLTDESPLLGG